MRMMGQSTPAMAPIWATVSPAAMVIRTGFLWAKVPCRGFSTSSIRKGFTARKIRSQDCATSSGVP